MPSIDSLGAMALARKKLTAVIICSVVHTLDELDKAGLEVLERDQLTFG